MLQVWLVYLNNLARATKHQRMNSNQIPQDETVALNCAALSFSTNPILSLLQSHNITAVVYREDSVRVVWSLGRLRFLELS